MITVRADGTLEALYEDDLPDIGERHVSRASTVEPVPFNNSRWRVILTDDPMNGRFKGWSLGVFKTRGEALSYEKHFIEKYVLRGEKFPDEIKKEQTHDQEHQATGDREPVRRDDHRP